MKKKTTKNKLYGTIMLQLGIITTLFTKDVTALAFLGFIGVCLLLAKENYID